jgi:hypothetical protein
MAVLTQVDVRNLHTVELLYNRIHVSVLKLIDEREVEGHAQAWACRVICTSMNQRCLENCSNQKEHPQ